MMKTAVRQVHPKIKPEKGKLLKSPADQKQQSYLKYMAPLKVVKNFGGWERNR